MKRLITFITAICMVVAITACGAQGNGSVSDSTPTQSSSNPTTESNSQTTGNSQGAESSESEKDSQKPGTIVSAIVGGGDFNAGGY